MLPFAAILACSSPSEPHPLDRFSDLPEVAVALESDGVQTCMAPAAEAGLQEVSLGEAWEAQDLSGWPAQGEEQSGGEGVIVEDFDGDGVLDILLPTVSEDLLFFGRLEQGQYRVEPADKGSIPTGFDSPSGFAVTRGGSTADADDDGDLDLYLLHVDQADRLLLNDGTGRFEDWTGPAGLPTGDIVATFGASWGDADSDGDLDLLLPAAGRGPEEAPPWGIGAFGQADPLALWLGDGAGGFTAGALPAFNTWPYGCCAAWLDLDGDLDQDAYLVNDFGPQVVPNFVLRQDAEGLNATLPTGLDLAVYGMGLAVGDLDGDLWPDFVVTDWGRPALLLSGLDEGWTDAAAARGLDPDSADRKAGWGAELVDVDNDGDLDVWMAFGPVDIPSEQAEDYAAYGLENPDDQRDALFLQQANGSFTEDAEAWGVASTGNDRGGVWSDLDQDGFVDLILPAIDGPARAFLSECTDAAWLTVRLKQPAPNRHGVGAQIFFEATSSTWARYVLAGATSVSSGPPLQVHVGLGQHDRLDRLIVVWPDGLRSEIVDVESRQHLTLVRSD